ncbi:hypothetical protein CSN65_003981 [Salmonella enterica subsp. diarizonae]|nr:hypothetical protein [Salmonella enterica subsp. diarizonae]
MKIINFIVGISIAFSCASMAESKNELPSWLNVSKQDYNTVRSFFLSGFAAKALKGETIVSSPEDIINDFDSNELAAEKKWDGLKIIYGEVRGVKNIRGEPVVELGTPGDKSPSLNYVRLKVLDSKRESLFSLSKGQKVYAACLGVDFTLKPSFKNCSLSTKEIEVALSYGGDYLFPAWDKFILSKASVKKMLISNDNLGIVNFAGYVMISGIAKDPLQMKEIKSCTPWNAGCYDTFVKIFNKSSDYASDHEKQLTAFFEDAMKSHP